MILVVTEQQDLTADLVVREMMRRGVNHARLNTERLLADAFLSFEVPNFAASLKEESGALADLNDVSAVWYRRPTPPIPNSNLDNSYRAFAQREAWAQALGSLFSLDAFWMNRPDLILRANHKLLQLRLATDVGLRIPRTLVTRDPSAADQFLRSMGGNVIAKPISHGTLDLPEGDRAIYTTRLAREQNHDLRALIHSPVILQEEIPKRSDIRLTVVGSYALAVEIDSQKSEETQVDWRRPSTMPLPHRPVTLPATIMEQVRVLCDRLGLVFAAIDFVEDQSGNYIFLEVNPNGQWGWIELQTGEPISSAIVDCLIQARRP